MPGEEAEGSFVGADGVALSFHGIVKVGGGGRVCPGCAPSGGPTDLGRGGSIPPKDLTCGFPRPPHEPAPAVCLRGVPPTPDASAHRVHRTECLSATCTHVPVCAQASWPCPLTSVTHLHGFCWHCPWFAPGLYNHGRGTLLASQLTNIFSWWVSTPHTFLMMSV